MTDKIILPAQTRTVTGKAVAAARAEGSIPAVVYGHGKDPQVISLPSRELEKAFAVAGGNQIIGLKVDDGTMKNVLIHDVQRDIRTGTLAHVDFYLVKMDEKIKTEVPIILTGESTAVYQDEGTLVRPLESVEIEALPGDLPESFELDIAALDDFSKSLTVADLKAPQGVEILTAPEELVAKVEPPRSEEELEELDEAIDEEAEMPEGAKEDEEVVTEDQKTVKEPQGKAAGAEASE